MNLIITMAGEGKRFKKSGINIDKWRINIKGRTMFEWSMLSLKDFYDDNFIFVVRKEQKATGFIEEKCAKIGIGSFQIIEIDEKTDGQATTAMKARKAVDKDGEIAIYNIDTYIEEGEIRRSQIDGEGHIPVFEAEGEKWSFAEINESNRITKLREKERISKYATAGFYYFRTFELFSKAYRQTGDEIKERSGEKYVAPLYNFLIREKSKVTCQKISRENVHVLGTPEGVNNFWPDFRL